MLCVLLYSLLKKKLWRNCYSKSAFFAIFPNFSSNWKSKWFAKLLHSLGAAKLLQTTLIFNLTENFVKLTEKIPVCNEISANLVIFFSELELISSLVNSIAILLRDRRLGGYIFANPWESYFIPRGFAPWDEIRLPRVAKTIASRSAITQYYIAI